jgi:hypothetical protein
VRNNVTGLEPNHIAGGINLFPNPGTTQLNVVIENSTRGPVTIQLFSILGSEVMTPAVSTKSTDRLVKTIDTSTLSQGVYVVIVKVGERSVVKKWIRY